MFQPRLYVSARDEDAVRIFSQTAETNIALSNVAGTFLIGASNNRFIVKGADNSNALIDAYYDDSAKVRLDIANGRITTSEIDLVSAGRRRVILDNFNDLSQHQFAGFGIDADSNVAYQVTRAGQKHVFYYAETALNSAALMSVAADNLGRAEVLIGEGSSNALLRVAGNAVVTGDLQVSGNIAFNNSNIVTTDPVTGRISEERLPSGLVYAGGASNLIDSSLLPREYTFQYLRGQQNVGIGTRAAAQKLHVVGSALITDRLGIGSGLTQPAARIHIRENQYSALPTILIENPMGSPVLNIRSSNAGETSFAIPGTRTGITVGTDTFTAPSETSLEVLGDSLFRGSLAVTGTLSLTGNIAIPGALYYDQTSNIRVYSSANFHGPLAASNITAVGEAGGYIRFQSTGINVDGDIYVGGQLYILSDREHKTNIAPLDRALDRVSQLRGYSYTLKHNGRAAVGLMADEIAEVLPEALGQFPGGNTRAVNYDSVIPLLVESVRELKDQVSELKRFIGGL